RGFADRAYPAHGSHHSRKRCKAQRVLLCRRVGGGRKVARRRSGGGRRVRRLKAPRKAIGVGGLCGPVKRKRYDPCPGSWLRIRLDPPAAACPCMTRPPAASLSRLHWPSPWRLPPKTAAARF